MSKWSNDYTSGCTGTRLPPRLMPHFTQLPAPLNSSQLRQTAPSSRLRQTAPSSRLHQTAPPDISTLSAPSDSSVRELRQTALSSIRQFLTPPDSSQLRQTASTRSNTDSAATSRRPPDNSAVSPSYLKPISSLCLT